MLKDKMYWQDESSEKMVHIADMAKVVVDVQGPLPPDKQGCGHLCGKKMCICPWHLV